MSRGSMILVDSPVWIDHLHAEEPELSELLSGQQVVMHMAVLGEVALGQMKQRERVLDGMRRLPFVRGARDNEVVTLIERQPLHGRGIGYVDAVLLASTLLTPGTRLWTRDKRLKKLAEELGCAW
ncbi:MAG: type II toxin-antitoxin system VapC family toxin [Aeromicrobium sp.]|uniref:type II toxin-antitoxin system VapC family toxin n=1 Tax=Aeromicrobium sp. TaxID=1871063 RepID=UPI0039E390A1